MDFDGTKNNFCDKNCRDGSKDYDDGYAEAAPVGSYPQGVSPYGVYDLAGNVAEWVSDIYDDKYYGHSPSNNPQGPSPWINSAYRVFRGGSWWNSKDTSSIMRYADTLIVAGEFLGFRCARSAQ